ncbi:NAD(P)/FAD-dependent oxidoreductase [Limnohabitans sp. Rim11]|jgi:predicted NAD/FAD-binding protein|uniref:NAD(P)/FAD-dependent oxidoreductase n=1 Tax=Limnohabitans sp. Rim11 TaxID=1100719 RepID=UPI000AF30F83|nr:FAD-dependent oxidoreductase [Limnohabitans sp. Rim11]
MTYKKIAIVGSGISGLAVAHSLKGQADITLFEAGAYFGGHSNTVDITLPTAQGMVTHGVDTGFLVFNERTYPNLIGLFAELGVETALSDMSFSVQAPKVWGDEALEWSGSNLDTVFAQRGNLLRPKFLKMLADVLRFNKTCTRIAEQQTESEMRQPLSEFLKHHNFSEAFKNWYFLPMMGCIWSCPTDQMLQFPVATMIRFCHNHGLIQVSNRPRWFTVKGGSKNYVQKIVANVRDKRLNTPVSLIERDESGVRIVTQDHAERFDEVVICTHSDQALRMLRVPTPAEQKYLSAIPYQDNVAVLHTDESVLPSRRKAWAAWNYERASDEGQESARVCLHYLLNKLQPLPFEQAVVVSLNPTKPIDPTKIIASIDYAHPVFDLAAIDAQQHLPEIQGQQHTWFAGAWMGYGFHEDGLKAGLGVARQLLQDLKR